MVLTLKRWKSRTSPGITAGASSTKKTHSQITAKPLPDQNPRGGFAVYGAIRALHGLRLSHEQEFQGADLSLHRIGATSQD